MSEPAKPTRSGIYLEDFVILVSVVALFVLTVFFRYYWWGQACLVAVLIAMVVVFLRRMGRVHRGFTGGDE